MLTILIALQVAQVQVAQPPVAKVASPDAVTKLQPMPKASPMRMHSKQRTLSQGRALLARAETVHVNAADDASKAELEAKMDQLKSDLDSLSEMGEMELLRLQMAMDRLAKMMETLSNMLKKMSDTQSAIVQNLKGAPERKRMAPRSRPYVEESAKPSDRLVNSGRPAAARLRGFHSVGTFREIIFRAAFPILSETIVGVALPS